MARAREGAPPRSQATRALAIVPARLASQRLPRKMLLAETGLPLCVHTALAAARSRSLAQVVIAADSEEVAAAAAAHGIQAVLTPPALQSGTDRVHAAFSALGMREDWGVVLNVQGDEPELDPSGLDRLVAAFEDPQVEVATLCAPLASAAEAEAPQVVKVVADARGDALYFSRSPIPARLPPAGTAGASARPDAPAWLSAARRHLGVYAFRPAALAEFCALEPGRLERLETLEQLRWLEAGRRIRVLEAAHVSLGIDTREDYDAFVERERRRKPRAETSGR
jgi:3-deoxy-manno-octulosonate cytidylyltransferase (CMP-KDO synthetase)